MGDVGRELPAELLPLFHFLLDRQLLLLDPGDQRGQLRVGIRIRVVQVQPVDGLDDLLGGTEGQHAGDHQHQHTDPKHRTDRHQRVPHRAHGPAQTQHRAVLTQPRVVHGGDAVLLRFPDTLALSRCPGLRDLLAVQLTGQLRPLLAVVQNGAVFADPGDPVGIPQLFQVFRPAQQHPLLGVDRLLLEGRIGLLLDLGILESEEQCAAQEQHGHAHQKCISKDCLCHDSSPFNR